MFYALSQRLRALSRHGALKNFKRVADYLTLAGLRLVDAGAGILKDVFLTKAFGLGLFLDAYFVTMGILDIFIGYSQVMGYAVLLPLYNSEVREDRTEEEVLHEQSRLINAFVTYLMIGMLGVAVVTVILHQWIGTLLAPNPMLHKTNYLDLMLLISLPISLLFQSAYAFRVVLIQRARFAWFHLPAIFSTFIFIGTFLLLYPSIGYYAVIWALPLSQIVQFVLYWYALGIRWHFVWRVSSSRKMLELSGPNFLNWLCIYLFIPVDNYFLGFLPSGQLSAFRYAAKITTVLGALTVFSLQMTMIPAITTAGSQQNWPEMRRLFIKGIRESILFSIPLIGLIGLMAPFLIELLFERGAFSARDSEWVILCLQILMFNLPVIGSLMVILRGWESLYLLKSLIVINFIALCLRGILDWVGLHYWGLQGIAWMCVLQSYLMLLMGVGYLFYRMKNCSAKDSAKEEVVQG